MFASFSTPDLQSNNVSDELVTRGVGKDEANRLSKLWFLNPAFGGPIVRDRLWFWASHTSQRTDQYVANVFFDANPSDLLYTPTDEQAIDDQLAQSTTVRLTAQATPRNKLTFFYDNNYNKRNRFPDRQHAVEHAERDAGGGGRLHDQRAGVSGEPGPRRSPTAC